MSPSRFRSVLLLLGLVAAGCDGTDADPGPPLESVLPEFTLRGATVTVDGTDTPRPLDQCYYDGDSDPSFIFDFSLLSGRIEFAGDGSYSLTLVGLRRERESTRQDTVQTSGSYEQHGAILQLSLGDTNTLFATVGPDVRRPTSLHLGAAKGDGFRPISCDRLTFAVVGEDPVATVQGGTVDADLSVLSHDGGLLGGRYPYVVLAGRDNPLRYDSARVDLYEDGRYEARLWYNYYSRPVGAGVRRLGGKYITEGPFYVFDPETARAAFAVDEGGEITMYRQTRWGQGFSGRLTMKARP